MCYLFMPVDTTRYIQDTAYMTPEQEGCYMRLALLLWHMDGRPLADDDGIISRHLRISKTIWLRRIKPVLTSVFVLSEGFWSLDWLGKQMDFLKKSSQKQRENVQKRWSKPLKDNETVDTTVIPSNGKEQEEERRVEEPPIPPVPGGGERAGPAPETVLDTAPGKEQSSHTAGPKPDGTKKRRYRNASSADYSDEFLEFYGLYPKKEGKLDAFRAYRNVPWDKVTSAELIHALNRSVEVWKTWPEEEHRYIPQPARWLNDERWTTTPSKRNRNGKRNHEPKFKNGAYAAVYERSFGLFGGQGH